MERKPAVERVLTAGALLSKSSVLPEDHMVRPRRPEQFNIGTLSFTKSRLDMNVLAMSLVLLCFTAADGIATGWERTASFLVLRLEPRRFVGSRPHAESVQLEACSLGRV
jgi:hypothetical protein